MSHKSIGTSYQYYAVGSDEQYHKRTLTSVISRYFRGSYVNAISALVKEEKVSVEELKELIDQVEKANKKENPS